MVDAVTVSEIEKARRASSPRRLANREELKYMSQHIVLVTSEIISASVWIQLGWDKPMSEFYMVVFESLPGAKYYDEGKVLYSNTLDPKGSGRELDYFKELVSRLGLDVPESLWTAAAEDKLSNVVNRTVFYSSEGCEIEAPWPEHA
jgi:hypothetical protein